MEGLTWQAIFKAMLQEIKALGIDAEVEVVLGDKDHVAAIKVKVHGKVEGSN